jgi:hypothetical protein
MTEYVDDDEVVPKNASVVVRRVPAKSAKTGLMARINTRGLLTGSAQKADIIMPMKADSDQNEHLGMGTSGEDDVFSRLAEEDT